jgi:allantoin racemase
VKQLLIINPNTTQAVTDRLHQAALALQHEASSQENVSLHSMTAAFGASYISDEVGYAIAGHATLDAWQHVQVSSIQPSAALIGCFGDPGLWALREMSGVPITGLAEAAFIEASKHGAFAVVTGGARWKPMLERLAGGLGFATQLQTIHTIDATGAELAADPVAAVALLREACLRVAAQSSVRSIILGGAGLAGYAIRISDDLTVSGVPLIDSVDAGVKRLLQIGNQD